MKIDSKPYGEIEIEESKTIQMVDGLFGFEDHQRFAVIGRESEQPFEWLQSLDDPGLAFVICRAQFIKPDYELAVPDEDYADIQATSMDSIIIYLIVVVPDDPQEMTVNFRGPVLINQEDFLGKQVINRVEGYGVKHRLLDEIEDQSLLQASGRAGDS